MASKGSRERGETSPGVWFEVTGQDVERGWEFQVEPVRDGVLAGAETTIEKAKALGSRVLRLCT